MKQFLSKYWFSVAVVALLIVIAVTWNTFGNNGKLDLPVLKPAAAFALEHADGQTVDFAQHDGKVRIVYFFWASCPDVCGPTNHNLSKVQERLIEQGVFGTDAVMYSISFDPRDTKEKLAEYSKALGADPTGWFFLTGDEEKIKTLAEQYGVSVIKSDKGDYVHTNVVTLVDRSGNIRKFYSVGNGNLDFNEVARAAVQLTEE